MGALASRNLFEVGALEVRQRRTICRLSGAKSFLIGGHSRAITLEFGHQHFRFRLPGLPASRVITRSLPRATVAFHFYFRILFYHPADTFPTLPTDFIRHHTLRS